MTEDAVHLVRLGPDPDAIRCMHRIGPDDLTGDPAGAGTHLQCEGLDAAGGVWVMRLRRVPAETGVADCYAGGEVTTIDLWASLRVPGWRSLLDAGWQVLAPPPGA